MARYSPLAPPTSYNITPPMIVRDKPISSSPMKFYFVCLFSFLPADYDAIRVRLRSSTELRADHCVCSRSRWSVQWLSYSPLDPRFVDSIPAGVDAFFQSVKILSMTSFGRDVKPWVPCRRITTRKRTSNRN